MVKMVKVREREYQTQVIDKQGNVLRHVTTGRKPDPVRLSLDVQRKAKQIMRLDVTTTEIVKTYGMPLSEFMTRATLLDVSDQSQPLELLDPDPEVIDDSAPAPTPKPKKKPAAQQ